MKDYFSLLHTASPQGLYYLIFFIEEKWYKATCYKNDTKLPTMFW